MFAIFKKELKVYFTSLLGYILISLYLFIAGFFFYGYFLGAQNTVSFGDFFADLNTLFLFVMPILTLRVIAEDKKLKTFELLFTSPLRSWEIIAGKFCAVFLFVGFGATLLLLYPLSISLIAAVEWGPVFSGYLGILFSVAFFISAGIFASSLTDNFVIAGLISYVLFITLYIISFFGDNAPGFLSIFLTEISYTTHYESFAAGLIHLRDIIYFIFGILFWLFLSKTTLELKSWK